MDTNGLLNPQGLWNQTGALLAAVFALAIIVPQHLLFFEGLLAALVLFGAAWLPMLLAAFLLAVVSLVVQKAPAFAMRRSTALVAFSRRTLAERPWLGLFDWLRQPVRSAFPRIPVLRPMRAAAILDWPRRASASRPPDHRRAA